MEEGEYREVESIKEFKGGGLAAKLTVIIMVLAVILMSLIWMAVPSGNYIAQTYSGPNFTIDGMDSSFQFYPNMRFANNNISYSISDECPTQKKNDAKGAFEVLANETVLSFYPLDSDGEIFVSCSDKARVEGGLFIAGEGGPGEIIKSGEYYVISNGEILLIRSSGCFSPNIAIHEILHVLGFTHSPNKNNIMHNFSSCNQEIGPEIKEIIEEVYSTPTWPNLLFEKANAKIKSKYLNTNISIRNDGFANSSAFDLIIFVEEREVKRINFDALSFGEGVAITLENVNLRRRNVEKIRLKIESSIKEISEDDNILILNMSKVEN